MWYVQLTKNLLCATYMCTYQNKASTIKKSYLKELFKSSLKSLNRNNYKKEVLNI